MSVGEHGGERRLLPRLDRAASSSPTTTSIVGSIGVVGGKIAADNALETHRRPRRDVPGQARRPGAAARAAYESLLTPWDDATRARLLATMTGIYELFLARVAEGRSMPGRARRGLRRGAHLQRSRGQTRGLVDEIGGLDGGHRPGAHARRAARRRAGRVAGETSGLLDALADDGRPTAPRSR